MRDAISPDLSATLRASSSARVLQPSDGPAYPGPPAKMTHAPDVLSPIRCDAPGS